LAELLRQEDQKYKQEIVDMQETPEQVRERMAKRVKELKDEKEQRRVEDVNRRYDKRF
jgi:DNA anti-recombination protein RmuC